MKLRFLGTGTSTGVPQIGCNCPTCVSTDPRDRRLRCSALLTTDFGAQILIDCGPDFYHQMLAAGAPVPEALLVTHFHYDHIGGIDDLRPYCVREPFPIYCKHDVAEALRHRLPYCFSKNTYPGVPQCNLVEIIPFQQFQIADATVIPLPVQHYLLDIVGFKIGNFAYITDCKQMPKHTIEMLKGIDTLVLNALRHTEHISHLCLNEALALIKEINPRVAYLTHLSHQMGPYSSFIHQTDENGNPNSVHVLPPNVNIAFDNLQIVIPS